MANHKFSICAIVDFDIEVPTTMLIPDDQWPELYRRGVEHAIRMMYTQPLSVVIVDDRPQ